MGQKIHPTGFRLSVSRNWASRWYASNRDFAGMLAEDIKVREYLKAKLKNAAVSRILIERPAKNARITIYSARPGVVIGKQVEDIENLKNELASRLGVPVAVNIEEVRKIHIECRATIGEVANEEHSLRQLGKAGVKRWMGIRPTVRGVAMNPIDHPHGGGEGRTGTGMAPVDPWGNLTKGYRTRNNKRTQGMIVSRRKK